MSSKLSVDQFPVFGTLETQAAVSASFNSTPTSLKKLDNVSYQYNVTGALVGTVSVQTSNDYVQNSDGTINFAGNWITIPSFTGVINGTGQGVLELVTMPALWMRTAFTYTSGSGTMNIIVDAKSGL